MDRLVPFEKLEADYYAGEIWNNEKYDSDDDISSDDELQKELKALAGMPQQRKKHKKNERGEKIREKSEFECSMENELDDSIISYANQHMNIPGASKAAIEGSPMEASSSGQQLTKKRSRYFDDDNDNDDDDGPPPLEQTEEKMDTSEPPSFSGNTSTSKLSPISLKSPKKSILKKPKIESADESETEHGKERGTEEKNEKKSEEDENPIKAKVRIVEQDFKKESVEFYDSDEDEANELWVAEEKRRRQGSASGGGKARNKKSKGEKPKSLDPDTDAVLSCPGCMTLLTRDCQRHEVYKEQYRAMFVENCRVEEEKLTIEKTGKEKRRQKQKAKKMGAAVMMEASPEDIFQPVKCAVCGTSVAVMDGDEVYHFFNVLAGYS